jgi:hypothetical protein
MLNPLLRPAGRPHAALRSPALRSGRAAARPPPPMPAVGAFSFVEILAAIEADVRGDIDAIAEACGKSRLSLANEYAAHLPPHGARGWGADGGGVRVGEDGDEAEGDGFGGPWGLEPVAEGERESLGGGPDPDERGVGPARGESARTAWRLLETWRGDRGAPAVADVSRVQAGGAETGGASADGEDSTAVRRLQALTRVS